MILYTFVALSLRIQLINFFALSVHNFESRLNNKDPTRLNNKGSTVF